MYKEIKNREFIFL